MKENKVDNRTEHKPRTQYDGERNDSAILQNADMTEKTTLKRNLSLFNIVAMLVSITGHVAVFITPGSIVEMAGSITSTFIVLCIGSFLVYSLALCFTELGTIFQSAGGPYLYLTLTFGNLPGFLVAWGYIILISGPFVAFTASTASLYIVKAILQDESCQSKWNDISVQMFAGCLLLCLAFLNCFCLKFLMKVQSALTLCKMMGIVIIIGAGMYVLSTSSTENFKEPFKGSHVEPGRISLAVVYVIFSTGGWQAVTTLTEEVKDPARTLPLAIHITFGIIVLLFFLTLVSYMIVLDKQDIIASKAIALLFSKHVWTPLVPIMSVLVALACIGALNTGIMGHSRVLLAAARKGDMPSILSTLHPTYRTPMVAVWAITLYGICMMYSGGVNQLMQFIGLYSLIMGCKVVSALLYLRYKKPHLSRPYKVPLLFPILQVVVCLSLVVLIIYQEPVWMTYGILIYIAGIPVYLLGVVWTRKPRPIISCIGQVTGFIQKLFKQVPS